MPESKNSPDFQMKIILLIIYIINITHNIWNKNMNNLNIFSINEPLFLPRIKPSNPNADNLFGMGIWI